MVWFVFNAFDKCLSRRFTGRTLLFFCTHSLTLVPILPFFFFSPHIFHRENCEKNAARQSSFSWCVCVCATCVYSFVGSIALSCFNNVNCSTDVRAKVKEKKKTRGARSGWHCDRRKRNSVNTEHWTEIEKNEDGWKCAGPSECAMRRMSVQ